MEYASCPVHGINVNILGFRGVESISGSPSMYLHNPKRILHPRSRQSLSPPYVGFHFPGQQLPKKKNEKSPGQQNCPELSLFIQEYCAPLVGKYSSLILYFNQCHHQTLSVLTRKYYQLEFYLFTLKPGICTQEHQKFYSDILDLREKFQVLLFR